MTHSNWINDNYHFLQKWTKIWIGQSWSDLLSHYTEWLDTNWEKFDAIPDDEERIKFSQKWLKNQSRWSNSDFNRTHKINDLSDEWTIPDVEEDHLLELRCESNREDIREWLVDVYVQFGDVGTNKLVKLREIYLKLEVHERVLWDLYYTNMNTMRDISKKLDIPLTAVYKMITDLNIKIKERYPM